MYGETERIYENSFPTEEYRGSPASSGHVVINFALD